jgi:hypothetical protein
VVRIWRGEPQHLEDSPREDARILYIVRKASTAELIGIVVVARLSIDSPFDSRPAIKHRTGSLFV